MPMWFELRRVWISFLAAWCAGCLLLRAGASRLRAAGLAPDQHRRGQVLDRRADRLEEGDLVCAPSPLGPAAERGQVSDDVGARNHSGGEADCDVAAFRAGGLCVDKDAGAPQRLVVRLAHRKRERADEIEMLSGLQPSAFDQRRGRERRAGDHVGLRDRALEVFAGACRQALGLKRRGDAARALRAAVPDNDGLVGSLARMGAREIGCERAGADDEQPLGVLAREVLRRQRRGGGGAPVGQPCSVERGERRARPSRLQHVSSHDRGQAARSIAGKAIDDLRPEIEAGARRALRPGGHQKLDRRFLAGALDLVMMALGRDEAAAHRHAQRLDQRGKIERAIDVLVGEDPHVYWRGRAGGDDCDALSVWASARHLSASARFWREARRWRPCDSQVAKAPATTPSAAKTMTTANRGAVIASAALSLEPNGSNDTITISRLAKAKRSRMSAMTARTAYFTMRIMPASRAPSDRAPY